jgi:hypothetical protein
MKRTRLVEADAESLIARLGDQAYFESRDRAQDEESPRAFERRDKRGRYAQSPLTSLPKMLA